MQLFKISDGVREIAKQMVDNPMDWQQGEYYFQNLKNPDIAFWTANGITFLHLRGNSTMSWVERIYLSRAIKKSLANKLNIVLGSQ